MGASVRVTQIENSQHRVSFLTLISLSSRLLFKIKNCLTSGLKIDRINVVFLAHLAPVTRKDSSTLYDEKKTHLLFSSSDPGTEVIKNREIFGEKKVSCATIPLDSLKIHACTHR